MSVRAWRFIWNDRPGRQPLPSKVTGAPGCPGAGSVPVCPGAGTVTPLITTTNRRMAANGVGRDRPPFPDLFRAAGPRDRALGQPDRRRPYAVVRRRRDAAVQAVPA